VLGANGRANDGEYPTPTVDHCFELIAFFELVGIGKSGGDYYFVVGPLGNLSPAAQIEPTQQRLSMIWDAHHGPTCRLRHGW
jgi:hypothetical protein